MLTNVSTTADLLHPESRRASSTTTAQKVVIINGSTEILDLLETVLDAGHYDVVFVESTTHAYSQIKRVQPNLVILCLHLDNPEGFQVLSMLKLDDETRDIPVLTYAAEHDDDEADEEVSEPSESEMFVSKPPEVWMN
jgi:PleD family two-component response regulator